MGSSTLSRLPAPMVSGRHPPLAKQRDHPLDCILLYSMLHALAAHAQATHSGPSWVESNPLANPPVPITFEKAEETHTGAQGIEHRALSKRFA